MKIVLDTNILVSALFWQGKEHQLLKKCIKGEIRAVTSPDILSELAHVMRDYFDAQEEEISKTIDLLMSSFEVVDPKEKIKVIIADEKDNRILECAIKAKANIIVSGDKHLLELKKYKNIKITKTTIK
ncbi:MAG: putative toxin-antitoxin system toxin component, PIN family [Candidatus Altiarchaeota archaeon]|nr:putative toxin-antitoxin system toxin component, PIN family [Candidatus Altiarchaeota archaeon]